MNITSVDMTEITNSTIKALKSSNLIPVKTSITTYPLLPGIADHNLMLQVFGNLISNAVKYSSKTAQPVIEIGSKIEKDAVVYFVKDNGAGFDMSLSSKLFRPFQRLHKRSDYEGTGVGLALSYVIVTKHGGEMWADAKVGEGATFYFRLPN